MAKKSILVTGGSGFIGKNILESLGSKYSLSAPGSHDLDLTNPESVERFFKQNQFDVVVHAASSIIFSSKTGDGGAEASLKMFQNVARCSRHFGKMIQVGSGAEYGKSRPIVRISENEFGKIVPTDEYGLYKYRCSKQIEESEGITCLRLFGCFGKYEDYGSRFISNAICRSLFGLPITIANKNVVFSYLYANDFARVVGHFIENEARHKFYNVVPDETADILSIARKVNEISGSKLPIVVKNPGMGNEYSGGNSRLRAEMPSFKFTPMEQSLRELYGWYGQNKETIDGKRLDGE